MENYKLNRIKALKDEVKDFHPLLSALLPKLPNITEVEYTHGIGEMGADFVLTKSDTTLDNVEYIGCIVKIGQIKQDHEEVNRQIEECEIERKISGGLRKIFLSEIWIISNGNITNGAQEKIHHKYKNKNIKFIPAEKVTSLVDKFYSQFWSDVSVQTGEYLRNVKLIADNMRKNNSLVDISSLEIYVPQELIKIRTDRKFKKTANKQKKVNLESILDTENHIIVEAMMGTGKSTLVAELVKSYSDPQVFNEKRILPIIVTATELSSKYEGDLNKVKDKVISGNGFEYFEKYLIVVDGLDEIRINSKERLCFLNKIYQSSCGDENTKVIVTTRSLDDIELESEIDKKFSRYVLCPLTIKQIVSLVEIICNNSNIKNKLIKDLDKSHLFRVLPKTPISAILLAKLLSENVQEIPSTMTDLYNKFMELNLGRWDMDKGLQSQQEYDVINNVTICLAQFIMNHSLIEISIGDTRAIFDTYTDSRNLKINKELIFDKLINKTEIFAFNKLENTISFRHRTFAEYFYALGLDRENKAVISESIYEIYWATSYFFYIGLKRDCPEILEAINNISFTDESYRILKVFHDGNFLLAAYLTPYEIIKKLVMDSFRNAAEIYFDSTSSESKSQLKKLTPVQLLCIITKTMCDRFGYEFFTDALRESAYEVYTHPRLSKLQFIELFLLNSVRVSLGQSDSYDTMIEDYGKNIPIQIQIGMVEHADDNKISSVTVNKYIKSFMKNMKSNHNFHNAVIDLYKKPADIIAAKRIPN